MKQNPDVREFDWELNSWILPEADGANLIFNIWHDGGIVRLSSESDLCETIDLKSRKDIDDLINLLTNARDDVFPA